MEKSYLAMDDGEKAAAEAENAMMLARVNFMVAMASALVPKDRNKINEQLVNSNWRHWRMVAKKPHARREDVRSATLPRQLSHFQTKEYFKLSK